MTDAQKTRVQFDFTEDAIEIIDSLRERMCISSRAEVIRLALGLLNVTYGHRVTIEDGGTRREVVFPS